MTVRMGVLTTFVSVAAMLAVACGGGSDDETGDGTPPASEALTSQATQQTDADADVTQEAVEASPAGSPAAEPAATATADSAADSPESTAASGASTETEAEEEGPDATEQMVTVPEDVVVGPSNFPQPNPTLTVTDVPTRPDTFASLGASALPWLQSRVTMADILPLFEAWGMPPVAGGDRLNLVDTNGDATSPSDGRSSIVIVFTDPATFGQQPIGSNLVIYDPFPDSPGQFQIAYDHNAVEAARASNGVRGDIAVVRVDDVTGDGLRDISFEELVCENGDCTAVAYVLSSEGDGYRRTLTDQSGGGS